MGKGGDSNSTQYGSFSGGNKSGVAGGQNLGGMFANFGSKNINFGTSLTSQNFSTSDMFKFQASQENTQTSESRADNTAGAGGGFSASIDAAAQVAGGGGSFGSQSKTSDNSGGDGLLGGFGGLTSSTSGTSSPSSFGSLGLILGVGAGAIGLILLLNKKK